MLLFELVRALPSCYSHLVMCSCVDFHAWSCIPVLIVTIVHVSYWFYSPLVIDADVDIHTWPSFILLLFTFGHVMQCFFSHLVMGPHVDTELCQVYLCCDF